MKKNLYNWIFLVCLVLFFVLFDAGVCWFGEEVWPYAGNDYEATRAAHPEQVWDRVFFGNSSVISAYRESLSEADYVNLGMDYGVVTDLWDLLRKDHLNVGSELVVGLNLFTLYDDFATNPGYIWHRGTLEPYVYFHRDKLMAIGENCLKLLRGEKVTSFQKYLYYGCMSEADLAKKVQTYETTYYCLPIDDFRENIEALDQIADWCVNHDVRLRILWMPFNPAVERPPLMQELKQTVNNWCNQRNITVADYTDIMDESCFHDVGHLNDEIGAVQFTKVVDSWLLS